jgi:hypothetical protein
MRSATVLCPLTNEQLRCEPVRVSLPPGSVSIPAVDVTFPASLAVTGPLTDAQLRASAIVVSINGTVAVSGGLTDTQLRANAVPVSVAALPLPNGAATETTLAAVNTKTPVLGQAAMAASVPVVVASNQTIPVSGPLTDAQLRAAVVPVSGTVTITPPALTKGTQAATGLSVQQLKDAGRANVNAATAIAGVTAVTTEAMLALNVSRDGAATASATTIAVTSGKRLRIIGVAMGVVSTAAAVISARISLRINPSGAVVATSPILLTVPLSQRAAALAQAGDEMAVMFPEAIEISGTTQIGLSHVASVATGTIWASLIGYEF